MKILIIDDEKDFCEAVGMFIHQILIRDPFNLDYDSIQITCQTHALNGIIEFSNSVKENNPYDLVFIDYCMPDINGMEVLTDLNDVITLSEKFTKNNKPILCMLTGYESDEIILKSFKSHADFFLVKSSMIHPEKVKHFFKAIIF